MAQRFLVAAAVGAVVAQLEGRTLGLAALAHAVLAMAHLDLKYAVKRYYIFNTLNYSRVFSDAPRSMARPVRVQCWSLW